MITQTIDPHHFDELTRRIRAQVSSLLTKWGLLPRFNRWRLTQDPTTGMVVLFGILNSKYIATHSSIPFSDYFDPSLLNDLADELQVQIVACNSDGLRYAFILDRGSLDKLPTHIDYPFVEGDGLFVRVVYEDVPVKGWIKPPPLPAQPNPVGGVDDQTLIHRGVGAFLKVFDDLKVKDESVARLFQQGPPGVVVIDKDEFNKRVAEHEAERLRTNRIRRLFNESDKSKGVSA